jgi:Mg2+-importing ATPase
MTAAPASRAPPNDPSQLRVAAGLSSAEARARLATYGRNVATPRGRSRIWILFVRHFGGPITLLLLGACGLSFVLGATTDAVIIAGIVVASGLLGFWQEHRASTALDALLALVRSTARVRRDGLTVEVPVDEVVPGDVLELAAGDAIAGDATLLEARDLFVDEATLSGESFPAEKLVCPADAHDRRSTLFFGTHVVSGTATALVVRTGRLTSVGEIAERIAHRPPETEFERGIRRFGYLLLEITAVLALCIFAVNVALDRPVLDSFIFTLAVAVGLTPQLLPAIVSVTLAHGARRMARERVLVKRLASIEDFGSMTVLCTDKTGTITEGDVRVHSAIGVTGVPSDKVLLLAHLNARFESGFANPIDVALRAEHPPDASAYRKVDELPYDFVRRRLSVIVERDGQQTLITKGAPASVLDICAFAEGEDGTAVPIANVRADVERRVAQLGDQGLRCLAVAYRPAGGHVVATRDAESGMTLIGLLALHDPPKLDAAASLAQLAALGVAVKIVTGDGRRVAVSVARAVGLDGATALTGADLHRLSDAALRQRVGACHIFAEVDPIQKERIVRALRAAGQVVGYLGDGINDVAAIHGADVGISVDTAVDVAKQSADVVLLERDLGDLARGVRAGRSAFGNTLKYVFITTSANFGNMVSLAFASLFVAFLPLLPKQILLINFLTDLPAVAVATDRLDPELVAAPRRWNTRDIRRFMLSFGLASSVFDILTFGVLLVMLPGAVATFRTGWFYESVLSELLILLVIRTRRPFFRSRPSRALGLASVAVALVTVALPWLPGGRLLGLAPLPIAVLIALTLVAGAYVGASEALKAWFYRGGVRLGAA